MPGLSDPVGTSYTLAANASATSNEFIWQGGPGAFTAEATFGGGTITLQYQTGNGTWISVGPDTTLTANGGAGFILPLGTPIRVSIATATAVYAYVTRM